MMKYQMLRNNMHRTKSGKSRGQSLMEFALTLPILLFVTMGIFDFGRALFTYAQASNALRNGLRYGTIMGYSEGNPQYTDCAGMLNVTRHVSFTTNDIAVTVSYLKTDANLDGAFDHSDAIVKDGVTLTCKFQGGKYTFGKASDTGAPITEAVLRTKIAAGTANGNIILVSTNANVAMITPVFPRYMPVVINGQRTLVKDIELFKCGDGIWAPTETCYNCAQDMGDAPTGAVPPTCMTIVRSGSAPNYTFNVRWADVVNETSYEFQYFVDTVPSAVSTIAANPTFPLSISGINCTSTFKFQVRAVKGTGVTATRSEWVTMTVSCTTIATGGYPISDPINSAPVAVSAGSTSPTNITFDFQDRANNEEGFRIFCAAVATGSTPPATGSYIDCGSKAPGDGSLYGNTFTWTDPRVFLPADCNLTFYYRARAYNNGMTDFSALSANSASTTLDCMDEPDSVTVTGSDTNRTIVWDASTNGTVTGYNIRRSVYKAGAWTITDWSTGVPFGTTNNSTFTINDTFNISNCADGYLEVRYDVQATDGTIFSPWTTSNALTRTASCALPPQAPTTLTVQGRTATSIAMNWTDTSNAMAPGGQESGFIVQVFRNSDNTLLQTVTLPVPDTTTATITGLNCGTSYNFKVYSYNANGNSTTSSNTLIASTLACGAEIISATCSNTPSIHPVISWQSTSNVLRYELLALRSNDVSGVYQVIRSDTGTSCSHQTPGNQNACFKVATYWNSSLPAERIFYYKVRTYWTTGGYSDSLTPVLLNTTSSNPSC
jgi:Flp pilus assembly protein TadG